MAGSRSPSARERIQYHFNQIVFPSSSRTTTEIKEVSGCECNSLRLQLEESNRLVTLYHSQIKDLKRSIKFQESSPKLLSLEEENLTLKQEIKALRKELKQANLDYGQLENNYIFVKLKLEGIQRQYEISPEEYHTAQKERSRIDPFPIKYTTEESNSESYEFRSRRLNPSPTTHVSEKYTLKYQNFR